MEPLSYFLTVISPPERIKKDVRFFKDSFKNRYGYFKTFFSIPHITVGVCKVPGKKVQSFFGDVKSSINDIKSYDLTLKNFDYFRNSRAIFIDVSEQDNFHQLVQKIELASSLHSLKDGFTGSSYPHMTIAKNLHISTFNKAQVEYFAKDYEENFKVHELQVLKWDFTVEKYQPFTTLSLW